MSRSAVGAAIASVRFGRTRHRLLARKLRLIWRRLKRRYDYGGTGQVVVIVPAEG